MRNLSILALSLSCSMSFSSILLAQAPAPGVNVGGRGGRGGGRAVPAPPAYEVQPDRTVTFKLRAPEATAVTVSGDFTQTALTLTKAPDGTWSVISGPLRP